MSYFIIKEDFLKKSEIFHISYNKVKEVHGIAKHCTLPEDFKRDIKDSNLFLKKYFFVKEYFDSDSKEFHFCMDSICGFHFKKFQVNSMAQFLLIIHKDNSADLYINIIPIIAQVVAKRKIKKYQTVGYDDFLDIIRIKFHNIEIKEDDQIIFCFKLRWKFGLYFDLTRNIDLEKLELDLGYYFKKLAYKSVFKISKKILEDGWFPFFQLIPNYLEKLSSSYRDIKDDNKRQRFIEESFLNRYDEKLINEMTEKWWKNEVFGRKKQIIQAGIEAYLQRNESGYVNCIKNLYSEIEGIIREHFIKEKKKNISFKEIKKYVLDKAKNKFKTKETLAFPQEFYEYLNNHIFKDFDLLTGEISISRHTTGHGVARLEHYTKIKAFQAILTLDQIYHYLTK